MRFGIPTLRSMARIRPQGPSEEPAPAPFIKWAGGKASLVPKIIPLVARGGYHRYFEPFLGGGAVFFALRPRAAVLSDSNPELINTYIQVRSNLPGVVELLHAHEARHNRDYYYKVRKRAPEDETERASWFIYLNRTCYNGLWRVNSKGEFNVPMGAYKHPTICDEPRLTAASQALKGARLACLQFDRALTASKQRPSVGDVVYLDPPYDPLSETSQFTGYTKESFNRADQGRLATVVRNLCERGVRVILSDSETPFVRSLYPSPPFTVEVVKMRRAISSVGSGRGAIPELLIHN